ncbi:MAG: NAD(P)/FAD-dependent oxidoreductase [Alphaproteobacteria bacterium]|nr:NAD(P)/FAD-dependent oxidoreductase [Alphaproteobacteria bacterium]MCB9699498.1 NAD(P)/FAD-dependent oxidoreductase [Alphaproteobacteria bacterium]
MKAIVIGGGQHGLAAAALLAREGLTTTVLEAGSKPGGLCRGREFVTGYRHTGIHHDSDALRPSAIAALALEEHGLRLRPAPPVFVPSPEPERALQLVASDLVRRQEATGFTAWRASIDGWRQVIGSVLDAPVPPLGVGEAAWPVLKRAVELRMLGAERMIELLRVGVASAEDWLAEHLAEPHLRAAIALPALIGSYMGPRSPHSAGVLLLREALSTPNEVEGGPAALIDALVRVAEHHGATIRLGKQVRTLQLDTGRIKGVELVDGEVLEADVVVSSLDPRATMLGLVPPGAICVPEEDEIRRVRCRSTSAKLHLALSRLPPSASRPDLSPERWRVVRSPRHLEQAFDDQKHGRLPRTPALDVRVPSLSVPGLAPEGHHVLSAHVFGVPARDADAWTEQERQALLDRALAELEVDRPGLRDAIVGHELLVAPDLEQRFGTTGGHLMHGEHALDQLWVGRPGPTYCRGRTPITGLFLASGGVHPMGGVSLMAGLLGGRAAAESR